ncbi:MAG: hypothetical protein COX20_00920 [Desulfobacterales bacterium CG23_combo_of_CG06-09_8_20_14_all_52_9]|nr:MAG: hypothetical protein COX20_00920 [Desulfobacterales bacterium CG23_combo_of_CG06-09_8_20_14_all_52_9]
MKEIRKLMVAIEFSENASELFDFAVGLASKLNSDLVAVNVINERDVDGISKVALMGYEISGENYVARLKEDRQRLLDSLIQETAFPQKRFKSIFKVGHPTETLIHVAVEEGADMIVAGIKAHTELEHFLVGSVAEKLFRHSPITLVSFRDEKSAQRLKKRVRLKLAGA